MWIRFNGMTEFETTEIIIKTNQLGTLNKVSINGQVLYRMSWQSGRFAYYAVVDSETATRLIDAGATRGEDITDYPAPTPENRCIYRALDAIRVMPDTTKIPYTVLATIEDKKFFLGEIEYIHEFLDRYGLISYEAVGAKLINGEEREAKSVVSKQVYETFKSISVPSRVNFDVEDKLVFQGIYDSSGRPRTAVLDPQSILYLDRVTVHNYDPVFRIAWTYGENNDYEYMAVDKTTAMMIAEKCKPQLRRFTEYPFQTKGDRCVIQSLPSLPIEEAEHRWDLIEEENGRKIFFGDIDSISKYRMENGLVATGINLKRNFKGTCGGSGYTISSEMFQRLKAAGVPFEDRLSSQLKDLHIDNSTDEPMATAS